jgi:hypothetical protein
MLPSIRSARAYPLPRAIFIAQSNAIGPTKGRSSVGRPFLAARRLSSRLFRGTRRSPFAARCSKRRPAVVCLVNKFRGMREFLFAAGCSRGFADGYLKTENTVRFYSSPWCLPGCPFSSAGMARRAKEVDNRICFPTAVVSLRPTNEINFVTYPIQCYTQLCGRGF